MSALSVRSPKSIKRFVRWKMACVCFLAITGVLFAIFMFRPDMIFETKNEKSLETIHLYETTAAQSYGFAYASDCRENMEILKRVVDKINKDSEIKWLIFGGDIVFNSDLYECRRFKDVTDKLKIPMLLSPGNHEMRGMGPLWFRYLFGRTYLSFTLGRDHFICLDDSNEKNFGYIQKWWLKRELAQSQDHRFRFVFFHVPLYDDRTRMHGDGLADKNPEEAERILNLLIGGRATHVFCSHLHGYYDGSWHGVPYTISAGSGSPLHPEPEENSFYNYLKITVTGDEYHIEVVRI